MSCTSEKFIYTMKPESLDRLVHLEKNTFIKPKKEYLYSYVKNKISCRKCVGCQKARASQRAVQLYCELVTTEFNSYFATLTYDDEHLPLDGSINLKHIQDYNNRLRKAVLKSGQTQKIRTQQCGEYGGKTLRAHYHQALLNLNIEDLKVYEEIFTGNPNSKEQKLNDTYKIYTSEWLDKIWTYGSVKIELLSFNSCIYMANHNSKKIGLEIPIHLKPYIHPVTGEYIESRIKDFETFSIGLGREWFKQFGNTDIYASDSIHIDGKSFQPPTFFDVLMSKENPELIEQIKEQRVLNSIKKTPEQNKYQAKFDNVIYSRKERNKV